MSAKKNIIVNMDNIWAWTVILATTLTMSTESLRIGFDKYHNHEEMTDYLTQITNEFPNVSSLYSIGKSVSNRELWVVKLTTATELLSVPNIKIVGNIHGNEPVGREIILHMIQYLLDNNEKNKTINTLLRTTIIHLMPSLNPDGFDKSTPEPCPKDGKPNTGSRYNANGFDLNRNFPDVFNPHTRPLQPEAKAIMSWMKSVPFVMSLALHGGSLVANYPYDGSQAESLYGFNPITDENLTQDDDVFRFLAKLYAKLHPTMHLGLGCDDSTTFKDGIINGAAWYQTIGSMQDYNYEWHGCLEITLELSCCKYPPPTFLETHWNENLKPLIAWMQQAQLGIKGIVMSQLTGEPISNATLSLSDRKSVINTTEEGEYWKILLPGVYKLHVNAPGYREKVVRVELTDRGPLALNVVMEPAAAAATATVNGTARNDAYWLLQGGRALGTTERMREETTLVLGDYLDAAQDELLDAYVDRAEDNAGASMRAAEPVSSFSSSAVQGRHAAVTATSAVIACLFELVAAALSQRL